MNKSIILFFTILLSIVINSAAQWQQIAYPTYFIRKIRFDNNNNLYLLRGNLGLYKTSNYGISWNLLQGGNFLTLEISDSLVYAGTNGGVLFVSKNYGATFNSYPAFTYGFNDMLIKNGVIYAGSYESVVYASSDTGVTWSSYSQGLPQGSSPPNSVLALMSKGGLFLSAMYGAGIYRSTNFAQNWSFCYGPYMGGIFCFAYNNQKIFLGTYDDRINVSTNNGLNWSSSSNGLDSEPILTIYVMGDTIFAGLSQSGAYISVNNGLNWSPINNGFPATINVNTFAVLGDTIWAGTSAGLWRRNISDIISATPGLLPHDETSIYPNPTEGIIYFNSRVTIESIEFFDLFGCKLIELNDVGIADNLEVNLSGLKQGIYLVRIFSSDKIFVKKLILTNNNLQVF